MFIDISGGGVNRFSFGSLFYMSIQFAVLFILLIFYRRSLKIYNWGIIVPVRIYEITKKRKIPFETIYKMYIRNYIPKYLKWYTPLGLVSMAVNKRKSQEYEKYHEREVIWLETIDGKSHFFTYALEMYKIVPILIENCKDKIKNININNEILNRYGK